MNVNSPSTLTSHDLPLAIFLALLLFGIYILSFDGTLHSTDGLSMLAVAENLVKHGSFDVHQLENWEDVRVGIDGQPYTLFPIGPTLFMLPFYMLGLVLPHMSLTQTTMILMPLSSALTAVYIYLSTRRLGYHAKIGITVTVLTGLATLVWPQSRDLVAEPLTLLTFTATFYSALAYRQDKKLHQAALMGLTLGIALLCKMVNIITVPFFLWYMVIPHYNIFTRRGFSQLSWQALVIATIPITVSILIVGGYNAFRFGNPLDSGYSVPYSVLFRTPVWIGFIGMLISPYKSIFLYVPIFVLIPFTIKETWEKHSSELVLILALLIGHMIIFGTFFNWGGGKAWGPRYLIPLNGLLTLFLLPFINQAFQVGQWRQRSILTIAGLISVCMQILGISARDYPYLDYSNYWSPPPNFSMWGELTWGNPNQWPIWGHLLIFNLRDIPVIWRWQWEDISHFDLPSLLAALLIIALGLGGTVIYYQRKHKSMIWPIGAWLVALIFVVFILFRNYNDPRSVKRSFEASKLWPAYMALVSQLPQLVAPEDAVIFTDRRFEFYLIDMDKSSTKRYLVSKDTQPEILETVPKLLKQDAKRGRIWLVTDELDNRQLAYSIQLWLKERGQPTTRHLFGPSVQLTAFEPLPLADWSTIFPEPQLAGVVEPDDYKFNGIAALLGWNWPELDMDSPPTLEAGQSYNFELYWIYHGKTSEDTFFIRLLSPLADDEKNVVTETFTTPRSDNPLISGQLLIEDTTITIPTNLPPGIYHLQIGFQIPVVEAGELIFPLPSEITKVYIAENN